jgi:hypothetical protein
LVRRLRAARLRRLRRSFEWRFAGWFLEYRGARLARLRGPHYVDLFWDGYVLVPIPGISWDALTNNVDRWFLTGDLGYRNVGTGEVAPFVFVCGRLPAAHWPYAEIRVLTIDWPPTLYSFPVALFAVARRLVRAFARSVVRGTRFARENFFD